MLKSHLFRVGLAAVTTLALVGCGGDPSSTDSSQSSSDTPPKDTSEAPSATFYLSAIPDEKITDQKAKFDKLAAYLTEAVGVNTE